ncbi:MAG TPA: SsrA-binding protein SmpB [Herpetosiphonaceae bacterium]
MAKDSETVTLAENRKARHDYFIEQTYEAGIVLTGTEIKSVRGGKVQLRGSYARIYNNEVFLYDAHIAPYEQSGAYFNHEPMRPRKLLLNRREINKLVHQISAKGLTLVPLRVYMRGRRAKVELGVAVGKKLHDKRASIADRDAKRQIERAMKDRDR